MSGHLYRLHFTSCDIGLQHPCIGSCLSWKAVGQSSATHDHVLGLDHREVWSNNQKTSRTHHCRQHPHYIGHCDYLLMKSEICVTKPVAGSVLRYALFGGERSFGLGSWGLDYATPQPAKAPKKKRKKDRDLLSLTCFYSFFLSDFDAILVDFLPYAVTKFCLFQLHHIVFPMLYQIALGKDVSPFQICINWNAPITNPK